jgi:hypothetical protein
MYNIKINIDIVIINLKIDFFSFNNSIIRRSLGPV